MSLSEQDRVELQSMLGSQVYDRSVSARAQMVLWHDEGYRKVEIAAMSGASRPTVDKGAMGLPIPNTTCCAWRHGAFRYCAART